jgi:hypothetical protein
MQVFVNISSRGCFYSEELCPSAFAGWLELRSAPFLPCSQLLPETGSIQILSYTLQRWSLVPIRDQCIATQPGDLSRPHFLGVGPSQWSKPITVPSCDPAYPSFCSSNFGSLPTPVYSLVVADLGILVLARHSTLGSIPTSTISYPCRSSYTLVISDLGNLPLLLLQSIIDRQNRGIFRGIPPIPKLPIRWYVRGKRYSWLLCPIPDLMVDRCLWRWNHWRHWLLIPRWTFQLQWVLHHTHTMVPLPTILGQQPFQSKPLLHINYEKRTFCFSMQ